MPAVVLDLDGATLETPRIAGLLPGRALLHRTEAGLVPTAGSLDDAMVAALRLLESPAVRVDVDLAVRRSGVDWRVHSWQGWRDGRVATVSTVDAKTYELSWLRDDIWRLELARAATAPIEAGSTDVPDRVELPYELLMATGEAWHRRRADLVAEVGHRLGAEVRVDGSCVGTADRTHLLIELHSGAVGRLQAMVSTRERVGRISWLRYADGWRQLTGRMHDGQRFVSLEKVDELQLGVEVSRLVTGVRA